MERFRMHLDQKHGCIHCGEEGRLKKKWKRARKE